MTNVIYVEFSSKLVSTMVWCLCIFVTIMAVPGFSRFIDYNINTFGAPPITYHYPTEQSFQLRDISSSYTPPFPQVTHVYTPPENTYRGFTYQTLDIYGGVSQVGFMTGSEANSLLQDSFKALETVEIPSLTINKTPNVKINLGRNEENKQTSQVKTESTESQQNFRTPLKNENPLPPTGYYFPPIQVNHFQAGASFIAPPLLNGQSDFFKQFGFISMTDKPDTAKLIEESARDDNTLPSDNKIKSDNNLPETRDDLSESSEQLRQIENLDAESSTLSSNEEQTVSNESPIATTERNIDSSSSTDISNDESSTSLSDINSTTKDEASEITDKPEPRNSEENSNSINDENINSNTSETTTTLPDKSAEETTTERSTDNE